MEPDVESGTNTATQPVTTTISTEQVSSPQISQVVAGSVQRDLCDVQVNVFFDHFSARQKASGACECAFIAWGTAGNHRAIDVPIPEPEDDVDAFSRMQKAYYQARGKWRRFIPFYGPSHVREATVLHIHIVYTSLKS